jgi:general secretion pathway protein C
MIHVVDQLHRLPQSPTAAFWTASAGGAVAVVMLARLTVLAISAPQLPLVDAPTAMVVPRIAQQPIANWHLFGLPMNGAQVAATTLSLTLRGTVDSSDPALGTAIIAGQDQKDAGYHVGDTLPGGGVLEAIHADHVEIRNDGRRESLALTDKPAANQTGTPASPAQSSTTANAPTVIVGATGARNPETSPQTTAATALGNQANVLPVIENGQMVGARISVADVALLERVGLRRDDVVLSIDGQPVAAGGFNQALGERLRGGGSVDLVVRRDGREQTVRVGR